MYAPAFTNIGGMQTTPGATYAPSRIVDPPGTMRTLSLIVVGRTGYVSLSKNLKLSPSETSVSAPMRNPSSSPSFTHEWTSHCPSRFFSAARISPRLSARLNSSNAARSPVVKFPSRRAAIASIRSRNCMRRFLQETNLAEDLAHPRARFLLHRHERQAQVFFDQAHQRESRFHRARARLDEVSFHQRQQLVMQRARFVPLTREREFVELRHQRRGFV